MLLAVPWFSTTSRQTNPPHQVIAHATPEWLHAKPLRREGPRGSHLSRFPTLRLRVNHCRGSEIADCLQLQNATAKEPTCIHAGTQRRADDL